MFCCPSCNTDCPGNANFCLNCGAPLKSITQKRGEQESDPQFSNDTMTQALKRLMPTSYVEKLLASKGKMEGERRVVTILFSDVKGSTSLAENLDPEEVFEVMNGAFNILIEPITRYEGTIARLMGDAILAFFGAPIAHEDDPCRACKAALEIVEGAKEFSRKLESEKGIKGFGVRVGINTGLVVVAEVGTDLRVEYTAMGDAVNVAARMESSAEPGTILITDATKKLIQKDFNLMSIGPIHVKGKSDPINTFRVLGSKNKAIQYQETEKFQFPLIGREQDRIKIENALEGLQNGNGGIISVTGDRGIGKSRLVSEVQNQKLPGLKWVEVRSLSYTSNKSYWTTLSLLKNYFGFFQDSYDQIMLDSIYTGIECHFGEETDEIFSCFEYFLNDEFNRNEKQNLNLEDLRAVRSQFHFAFKELIKRESAIHPIVLVWEDIQWCDVSSLKLLYELFPLGLECPVIFLLQYRLDVNEKRAWDFHENKLKEYSENLIHIPLRPLEERDIVLLINNLAGNHKISSELQSKLIQKSEGNPSFLEELISSILERSELNSKRQTLESLDFNNELQLPDSLHNVIMSRVDCLEQTDKLTLQTAAVIGRVFPKKLLARILNDRLKESEFESSLNQLQSKEFILRHLPSNISSGTSTIRKEFIFKQDLSQNVLYSSLLLSQRQALHKIIGVEIENLYSENVLEHAESLAFHFEKGKDFTKAAHYNKVAGDRAKDFFANADAILFYSRALELLRGVQTESHVIAQIHESLGDVFFLTADYSKSAEHFIFSLNNFKDIIQEATVYYKLGRMFERGGNYAEALSKYNKALKLINQKNEKIFTAQIYSGLAMVYYRLGKLIEAEKFITKAFQIFSAVGDSREKADVYNNMGIIHSKLGEFEKALGFHKKCLKIREQFGVASGLAATYNNIGYLYHQKNELKNSIEYFKKSLQYCEKTGNLHGLAKTYDNLSQIYLALGNNDEAVDYNLKAVSLLGKITNSESQINEDLWLQSGVW